MSAGEDERRDVPPEERREDEPEGVASPEPPTPPPATWAGRQAQEGEQPPPAEPPGPEQPPSGPPPPVEEPPDPEAPEPVEEPHAPGAPPSGEAPALQDTVEADSVPGSEGDEGPESEEEEGEPAEEGEAAEGAEGAEDVEHAEEAEHGEEAEAVPDGGDGPPPPGAAPALAGAPAAAAGDDKPPRAGLWPRFLAASFVIVISFATATAASLLLYLTDIAEGLGGIPGVQKQLDEVDGGEPQTVLILGSDIRPAIEEVGRSDTTMLLRLDPDKQLLSLLSLPRDLQVNIPGYGIGKLNEAYSQGGKKGGPQKTLQVVKNLTGLEINHVVNIDFAGFAEAVNAIECVFVDVDRDYFNTNDDAVSAEDMYAEIDINPGYQQLCGYKALQYVRYRHDDNDLVRAARQQSFLREARQKVPPSRLFARRQEFIDIFTKYTTSDIKDPIAMLDVLKLFIELRDAPVRRIEFQGNLGGPDSAYVTASNEQIRTAVAQFLGEEPAPTDREAGTGMGGGDGGGGGDGRGGEGGGGDGGGGGAAQAPALIDASDAARRYALDFDRRLGFPVIAPVKLKPGSSYSEQSRAYRINTWDGDHYPSYKLVFPITSQFGITEYYGAMGTRWKDPPILENPSETRQVGDREYLLFYEGDRLQVVGFKTSQASYWVSNTLLGTLSEQEMLGVAESMRPYSPEQ